jgi:glycosyltransferase involved in cell wall biosynthesis
MPDQIKKLYLFNLSTDLDNPLLAFTHDWIIAASDIVESVEVVSTHLGRRNLPGNVRVRELGGGTFRQRVCAILKCLEIFFEIVKCRSDVKVFYHMTNKVASILSFPLRLIGVKQAIWYSHSANPLTLKVASRFCDFVYSSAPSSLPFSSTKCRYVGHGINFSNFPDVEALDETVRHGFVSLGRIAPIKNIEKLLDAISQSTVDKKQVDLIGPFALNDNYQQQLQKFADERQVKINFRGPVAYGEVPNTLAKYSICYTGNPNTTDKAAIESAAVGCFVISDEPDTQKLTGMNEYWQTTGIDPSDLVSQINFLLDVPIEHKLRLEISIRARERNNVKNAIDKIMTGLRDA